MAMAWPRSLPPGNNGCTYSHIHIRDPAATGTGTMPVHGHDHGMAWQVLVHGWHGRHCADSTVLVRRRTYSSRRSELVK
eukprot:SAG22_NODE_2051_length_3077_cov_41.063465_4_plen_79_part_00